MPSSTREWALVTGASSGLGVELARVLARKGKNVVLAARRHDALEQLAAHLRQQYGVETAVENIDLARSGSAAELEERLDKRDIEPGILVNNAAFGLNSPFIEQDSERLKAMLQLDVFTVTDLSHRFAQRMAARGRGHILLVASMAAYNATPFMAAYGAAKAYVLSFGIALHVELAPKVGVTVLSPGLMDTEFNAVSGFSTPARLKMMTLTPAKVAEIGINALFAGKSSVIAGKLNRIMALSGRLATRHFQAKAAAQMARDSEHTWQNAHSPLRTRKPDDGVS